MVRTYDELTFNPSMAFMIAEGEAGDKEVASQADEQPGK